MMTSAQTFFLKHWTARRAARHFEAANYGSVLKVVRSPVKHQDLFAVHLNLYRLLALRETEQEEWAAELSALNEANWLGGLNQDEKNYILVYLLDRLFGDIDILPYIRLKNVSEATRDKFSIDPQAPEFERFFRRHSLSKPEPRPIQLFGFPAQSISASKVIRFSGNYQNHKLFCLGKGSSFFS